MQMLLLTYGDKPSAVHSFQPQCRVLTRQRHQSGLAEEQSLHHFILPGSMCSCIRLIAKWTASYSALLKLGLARPSFETGVGHPFRLQQPRSRPSLPCKKTCLIEHCARDRECGGFENEHHTPDGAPAALASPLHAALKYISKSFLLCLGMNSKTKTLQGPTMRRGMGLPITAAVITRAGPNPKTPEFRSARIGS